MDVTEVKSQQSSSPHKSPPRHLRHYQLLLVAVHDGTALRAVGRGIFEDFRGIHSGERFNKEMEEWKQNLEGKQKRRRCAYKYKMLLM